MSDRAFYGPADSWLEDYKVVYAEDYYKLERELAEASETLNAVLAGATKQAIELTAHKAALEKCDRLIRCTEHAAYCDHALPGPHAECSCGLEKALSEIAKLKGNQ